MGEAVGLVRSLGFGGSIGGALGALAFIFLPDLIPDSVTFDIATGTGGLIGLAGHQVIGGIAKGLPGKTANFYARLVNFVLLARFLPSERRAELYDQMVRRYLLEDPDE